MSSSWGDDVDADDADAGDAVAVIGRGPWLVLLWLSGWWCRRLGRRRDRLDEEGGDVPVPVPVAVAVAAVVVAVVVVVVEGVRERPLGSIVRHVGGEPLRRGERTILVVANFGIHNNRGAGSAKDSTPT